MASKSGSILAAFAGGQAILHHSGLGRVHRRTTIARSGGSAPLQVARSPPEITQLRRTHGLNHVSQQDPVVWDED